MLAVLDQAPEARVAAFAYASRYTLECCVRHPKQLPEPRHAAAVHAGSVQQRLAHVHERVAGRYRQRQAAIGEQHREEAVDPGDLAARVAKPVHQRISGQVRSVRGVIKTTIIQGLRKSPSRIVESAGSSPSSTPCTSGDATIFGGKRRSNLPIRSCELVPFTTAPAVRPSTLLATPATATQAFHQPRLQRGLRVDGRKACDHLFRSTNNDYPRF